MHMFRNHSLLPAPMQAKLSEVYTLTDTCRAVSLHGNRTQFSNPDCIVLQLGLNFICCLYLLGYARTK